MVESMSYLKPPVSRKKIIACVIVVCIIITSAFFCIRWKELTSIPPTNGAIPAVVLSLLAPIGENMNRTHVTSACYGGPKPTNVKWYIKDSNDVTVASKNFPATNGTSTTSNGISVTWYDMNGDGRLSTADMIDIYDNNTDVSSGYKFRLKHIPLGETIGEVTYP